MVKQANSAIKNQKNNQTDSDESFENLSKDKKDIFGAKKTKRRSRDELKHEKIIQCPLCSQKKEYASFPALYTHIKFSHNENQEKQQVGDKQKYPCNVCDRKYSSLASFNTHMLLAHDDKTKDALQKNTKSSNQNNPNQKKPKKGRPSKQIQESSLPSDFEMIDDIEQKYHVLNIFENENFISVLQNVMFTEGYLCRNHQSISCEVLTKQQIKDQFIELKDIFKIKDSLDWLNDQVFDYLIQLSELILDEAFIILFYAYYNQDYHNLLQISNDLKQDKCGFRLVHEVLIKESQTEDLQTELSQYFKDLHISFQNLIQQLQNSPNQPNQFQFEEGNNHQIHENII
ncbi:hypothetical protein ABPG72_014565 [Tetrahymena utriculariae]